MFPLRHRYRPSSATDPSRQVVEIFGEGFQPSLLDEIATFPKVTPPHLLQIIVSTQIVDDRSRYSVSVLRAVAQEYHSGSKTADKAWMLRPR